MVRLLLDVRDVDKVAATAVGVNARSRMTIASNERDVCLIFAINRALPAIPYARKLSGAVLAHPISHWSAAG
jgi:hypothetical protein